MAYHHDSRRIFVGQDNGAIMVCCCDFSSECKLELVRLSVSTRRCLQLTIFLSLFGMQLLLNGWTSWQFTWDIHGRAANKQGFFWLDVSQLASRSHWAISVAVGPNNYTSSRNYFEEYIKLGRAPWQGANRGCELRLACIWPGTWLCLCHHAPISGFSCCKSFYDVEISTLALKFQEAELVLFPSEKSSFCLSVLVL